MRPSECLCVCKGQSIGDPEIHPVSETMQNGERLTVWMCDACGKFVCHATEAELAAGLSGDNADYWSRSK